MFTIVSLYTPRKTSMPYFSKATCDYKISDHFSHQRLLEL
jgi:hypothetical protein